MSSQKYVDYPTKCHAHFFVMAINAEGNVTFCKNTKDNPKFYIGNLYKKTFSDIWLSSKINQKLEKDIKPKNCATFCKNMQINTAIEDSEYSYTITAEDIDPNDTKITNFSIMIFQSVIRTV